MGKRERRRRRERAKLEQAASSDRAASAPSETQLLIPSARNPLLRVLVNDDAPAELHRLCLRYWAMDPDEETWQEPVADLGMASWVTATISHHSRAFVLHRNCGEETEVASRSQLATLTSTIRSCAACAAKDDNDTIPPQRSSTDHEDLDPNEYEADFPALEVHRNPDAPSELVAIGEQYWQVAYEDHENSCVYWNGTVSSIDTAGWGPAYLAAAAGVSAIAPGYSCERCEGELVLTSRAAYERLWAGESGTCVRCTAGIAAKVQRLLDPGLLEERRVEQDRARERGAVARQAQERREQWKEWQQDALASTHPQALSPNSDIPHADVRTEVAALALLRFSPATTPIPPVRLWPNDPLHPVPSQSGEVVADAVRARLLRIHPDSPTTAFVWTPPSLHDALIAAGGDVDALAPPELTDLYMPSDASHFVPYGTSMGTAAELLDQHLASRLQPPRLPHERQLQFLDLVEELIAAEAIRYFDYQLEVRHLPPVPENHVARLRESAVRAAGFKTLGQVNSIAWYAVVRASDAAQKHPRAPRANMTTYAVNSFESMVHRAVAEPHRTEKSYVHDRISGMSRLVFYALLDADPFTTTVADVRNKLPTYDDLAPSDTECDAPLTLEPQMLEQDVRWLRDHQQRWEPEDFRKHLLLVAALRHIPHASTDDTELAAAAQALQHILHDNQTPDAAPHDPPLDTCSAARLLTHPVLRDGIQGPSGQWVVADFVSRLKQETPPL